MLDSWNTKIPPLRAHSVFWRAAHQETIISIGVVTAARGLVAWELGERPPESARGNQGRLSRRGKGSEAG